MVDLADPDLFARGDQYATWRLLRETGPVHWHPPTPARPGFWSVVGHAEVTAVLSDHRVFTSSRGTLLNLLGEPDPAAGKQLAATDPPLHDRMRRPLQAVLNVGSVRPRAERIRQRIGELLEPLRAGENVDFAVSMLDVPFVAVGPMLGLPEADWPRLAQLVVMCSAEDDPDIRLPTGAKATLQRAHRELFAYFLDIVARRRKQPGEDLVSLLLGMEVDGSRLSPGAVVSNCYSLLLGATATTPHVPTAVLAELIATDTYPQWAAAVSDREFADPAVEEALRWASPAAHFMRHATVDTVLGDIPIAAGDPVVAWLGAANRDPRVFTDPEKLDCRTRRGRHVAFGAGHHYCLGAPLARLVIRELFAELSVLFEGFEAAGTHERYRSTFLSGFKHLPVAAAARASR